MRSMSVARQFTILIAAFAVAMPAGALGMASLLYRNFAAVRQIWAEGNRQNDRLFALVGTIGKAQSQQQRLLREKDPDEIERTLDLAKAASARAAEAIQAAGGSGDVARAFQSLEQANGRSRDVLLQGDFAQAQEIFMTQSNPAFESLLDAVSTLQAENNHSEEAATTAADARNSRSAAAVFCFVGIFILVLVTAGVLLVRKVNGDLVHAVRQLTEMSKATAAAVGVISRGSQTLANGAGRQAAALQETSESGEEISGMTRSNAEHSRHAAEQMKNAAGSIADANAQLKEMIGSMHEIRSSGDKVARIVRTIDEIAFQTNILALNAAVEAARAGEYGMGFAVVADEVRNLAHRSAEAARNTATLIEESMARSKDGQAKLDRMADAIASITANAGEVDALMEEIRQASDEQARGIEQITGNLARMQQMTQTTASGAEENAAAGEELSAQVEALNSTVRELAVMMA